MKLTPPSSIGRLTAYIQRTHHPNFCGGLLGQNRHSAQQFWPTTRGAPWKKQSSLARSGGSSLRVFGNGCWVVGGTERGSQAVWEICNWRGRSGRLWGADGIEEGLQPDGGLECNSYPVSVFICSVCPCPQLISLCEQPRLLE